MLKSRYSATCDRLGPVYWTERLARLFSKLLSSSSIHRTFTALSRTSNLDYELVSLRFCRNPNATSDTLQGEAASSGSGQKKKPSHNETKVDVEVATGLALYSVIVFVVAMLVLYSIWPKTSQELTLNATRTVTILGTNSSFPLGPETLLLLSMALSGIIGACVYSFYAIAEHLDVEKDFDKSWAAWYLLRPPLGAGLALILSFLIRGGILTVGANLTGVNLIGLAAISALAGLFAEHVIRTLHQVADTIFKHDTQRHKAENKGPR